jgi:3-isopropylmalate/(R)-2-methylmalate dehydratase small subunit
VLRGDDSMEEVIRGRAFVFGDNINTDLIHPAKYFSLDYKKIKEGLFKGIDSSLAKRISEKNSVIVAGKNFGCGSSREVSAQAFVLNNIKVIIAESFARIFFRNCINQGIILVECPNILAMVKEQDELIINVTTGNIKNINTGKVFNGTVFKMILMQEGVHCTC